MLNCFLVYSSIIPNKYDEEDYDGVVFRQIYQVTIYDLDMDDLVLRMIRRDSSIEPKFDDDVFVVSEDNSLVYFLYDDRGLDIASDSLEKIAKLYETRNSWILDYDRALIEAKFARI